MSNNQQPQEMMIRMMQQMRENRLRRFRELNRYVLPGQIVLSGSSLMEQFPVEELLYQNSSHPIVYNRGIGGEVTSGLLETLDTCIFALSPAKVFINIGTNDMNRDFSEERLINNYREILCRIRQQLPDTQIYLLSYYPVNEPKLAARAAETGQPNARTNAMIRQVNERIHELAEEMHLHFLDLHPLLTDERGQLRAEYTEDGIHFFPEAYRIIFDFLLPYWEA
jgi:lysophospholipase L1-like esterase